MSALTENHLIGVDCDLCNGTGEMIYEGIIEPCDQCSNGIRYEEAYPDHVNVMYEVMEREREEREPLPDDLPF